MLLLRLLGAVAFGYGGWSLGQLLLAYNTWWALALAVVIAFLGFILTPLLVMRFVQTLLAQARRAPARALFSATIGLVVGLVIAALLSLPLSMLPAPWGQVLPSVVAVFFGVMGTAIVISRDRELFNLLPSLFGITPREGAGQSQQNGVVILDTSVIIDGRIAEISQTGFIPGALLVPAFVLDELRHIADSSDMVRRNRGRRGLEVLAKLQKEADIPVQIMDMEMDEDLETDARLVRLAKELHCPIVTNDFNLNRVAEIQGVRVLNINELANAVKSVVMPGEEMAVRVIQEGKEAGQGVGFLDDGTMVVVEGGRRFLNARLEVVVTRVLQTAAGRMIFAYPKGGA
ncbi:MAG: PIN domain nuclease [Chloroflexi bacterium]|nr:PIN domain nuclease [Chloroflexota bacterium]